MIKIVAFLFSLNALMIIIGFSRGKNFFEKMLFANSFGNSLVLFMTLLSLFEGNSSFVDIAIIYVLLSFITNIAILKKFKNEQ